MSRTVMLVAVLLMTMFSVPAFSASHEHGAGNIKMESAHDPAATLDRLEAIFKEKGITVFARVNHAAGAKKIGADLPPTELLIFGNPKLGTPLMKVNRETGLDLPMKALAWTDDAGKNWLVLTNPVTLKERYKLDDASAVIDKMTGAVMAMGKKAAGQ